MPIRWKLKKWLANERNIYRPSELHRLLVSKTDIRLSRQAVSALVNDTPRAIRLQTIQALCNALNCNLNDFCEVFPDEHKDSVNNEGSASDKLSAGIEDEAN